MGSAGNTPVEKNERLIESAAVLLSAAHDKTLPLANLNKALFYLDLCAFRDVGHVVTKSIFFALHQGPFVAQSEKRLVKPLIESGIAAQAVSGSNQPLALIKTPRSFKHLTEKERAIATKIGQWFSKVSATKASDYSRKNPGWVAAYKSGQQHGKPPVSINMLVAMQQVATDDPWMKEPPDGTVLDAVSAPDKSTDLR